MAVVCESVGTTKRKPLTARQKLPNDLTGIVFGRLEVVRRIGQDKNRAPLWSCRCRCGNGLVVTGSRLRQGITKSCGCLRKENTRNLRLTHGAAVGGKKSGEYRRWRAMKERCLNKNSQAYPRYGGRGITVCDRWVNNFEAFLEDMGHLPTDKHTVERKDVNGNYEPDNCCWATKTEQANNTSLTRWVTLDGITASSSNTAKRYGVNAKTFGARLRRGIPPEKAIRWEPSGR